MNNKVTLETLSRESLSDWGESQKQEDIQEVLHKLASGLEALGVMLEALFSEAASKKSSGLNSDINSRVGQLIAEHLYFVGVSRECIEEIDMQLLVASIHRVMLESSDN